MVETRLIAPHMPRFNAHGKRWRRFAYLKLDPADAWPRMEDRPRRGPRRRRDVYLGPFPTERPSPARRRRRSRRRSRCADARGPWAGARGSRPARSPTSADVSRRATDAPRSSRYGALVGDVQEALASPARCSRTLDAPDGRARRPGALRGSRARTRPPARARGGAEPDAAGSLAHGRPARARRAGRAGRARPRVPRAARRRPWRTRLRSAGRRRATAPTSWRSCGRSFVAIRCGSSRATRAPAEPVDGGAELARPPCAHPRWRRRDRPALALRARPHGGDRAARTPPLDWRDGNRGDPRGRTHADRSIPRLVRGDHDRPARDRGGGRGDASRRRRARPDRPDDHGARPPGGQRTRTPAGRSRSAPGFRSRSAPTTSTSRAARA